MIVLRIDLRHVAAVGHLQHVLPAVGIVLVGAEEAEVLGRHVELHDVAQELAHHPRRLDVLGTAFPDLDGIVPEVGQLQVPEQQSAIGMRIVAHAAMSRRGQGGELGTQGSAFVEQLLRPVAPHPPLQDSDVLFLVHVPHRHLVSAPIVFALLAVDLGRAGPALGRAKHDHRPGRSLHRAAAPGLGPDLANVGDGSIQGGSELLMDLGRVASFDEQRRVAHALEELAQLLLGNARQEAGIGDLVSVEVEDRQHGAVAGRIEELVAVPAGRQRPGLRLSIADHAGDHEVRVVEGRAIGMAERIAELASLMDAARRLGRHVAGNPAGEAELLEQPPHAVGVLADVRVDLAVGAFEIGVGDQRRPAVARPDHVDHVEIVALDDPVEVDIEHVQPGRGSPVPEQPRLDVLALQRLLQERVVEQVDLAHGQVVGGPPIGVHRLQFRLAERRGVARLPGDPCGLGCRCHRFLLGMIV